MGKSSLDRHNHPLTKEPTHGSPQRTLCTYLTMRKSRKRLTQRGQTGVVADEGHVDTLLLASLQNGLSLGNLVLSTVDLDVHHVSLGS